MSQPVIPGMIHHRTPITEATRRLLCHFAAGDGLRPMPQLEADWEEVFIGVCRNGLLGLAHSYLKQQPAGAYPPSEFRQRVHQASRLEGVRMAIVYRLVGSLLAHLTAAGLNYIVLPNVQLFLKG